MHFCPCTAGYDVVAIARPRGSVTPSGYGVTHTEFLRSRYSPAWEFEGAIYAPLESSNGWGIRGRGDREQRTPKCCGCLMRIGVQGLSLRHSPGQFLAEPLGRLQDHIADP